MRVNLKAIFARGATGLLLLGLAAGSWGCGGGGGGEEGPLQLVIWEQRDPQEQAVMQGAIDEYLAAHPDIRINLVHYDTENLRTQYQTAALAGGGPDLVYGPSDQVGPFSILAIIKPLDEFLPAPWWERLLPAAMDTLNDHVWAIPDQVGNHLTLLYNTDLVPEPPTTFAEFVEIARANTVDEDGDGRMDRYGLAMDFNEPFWMIPFLTANGGWVMDDQARPTLDNEATVKTLEFFRALRDEYKVIPRECDYQLMDTLFKGGKAAMIVNGPWSFRDYLNAGVSFKLARLPRATEDGPWAAPMIGSKGYSVNANLEPRKEQAVKDLLEFLLSTDVTTRFATELGILPSVKAAYENPQVKEDPILLASLNQWEVGRRMPVVPEMRVIWDAMRPNQQAVMNGSRTPAEAARRMQEEAMQKIEAMRR